MPTYTIHAPPQKIGETAEHPERFLFVRDGFHFFAFLFSLFWLLRYRLWLALVIYALIFTGFLVIAEAMKVSAIPLMILPKILIGLEASTLRRRKLARRGWKTVGFVVGDDEESAERRFFAEWVRRVPSTPSPPAPAPSMTAAMTAVRQGPPGNDVIGLFPEPELKP